MDDFKIGDDFDEHGVKEHKINRKLAIIIVVVIALIIGLLVFFISNAIFGGGKEEPLVDQELKLTDQDVQTLYSYVSYKNNGYGNDLFLRETDVDESLFNNQDKLYYTLQFITSRDLIDTEETNDKKQRIYELPVSRIKKQFPNFFGKDVSFSPIDKIDYKFDFLNDNYYTELTYSEEDGTYKLVFTKEDEKKEKPVVEPYYTELISATKKVDESIVLQEKVIYTTVEKENDTYKIGVYKDFNHTTVLESRQGITQDDLKANPISIDKYIDKAATVSYTFKVNLNKKYYFDNSSISY